MLELTTGDLGDYKLLPYIKGKALLVITKLDSEYVPFEVNAYIQSCNGGEIHEDSALETF